MFNILSSIKKTRVLFDFFKKKFPSSKLKEPNYLNYLLLESRQKDYMLGANCAVQYLSMV